MRNLNTSSGILKNIDKPRVGVISCHSVDSDFLDEVICQGINLSYEAYKTELESQGLTDDEIEKQLELYESQEDTYLWGDWIVDSNGKYQIDHNGKQGLAVSYQGGTLCVEYSQNTVRCGNTSPCFIMSDGSGPCGNLDTKGEVLAYALPKNCIRENE